MWITLMGAALVSGVFSFLLIQRWLRKKKAHQLAWSVAMLFFAIASFAAAIGMLDRWTETLYRVFYLFGAIINVPVLGLGTVYLLAPKPAGHALAALVVAASVYAAGAVFTASIDPSALAVDGIPAGREVLAEGVRSLSRYYSYAGTIVVVGGALWSAWKLSRREDPVARRLAHGNVLIAVGTFIVAAAGGLSRVGSGDLQGAILGVGLLAGVSTMFVGFLRTRPDRPEDTPEPSTS